VGLDVPWEILLREHLQNRDSRAAVLISLRPLLVAACTDELDCAGPVEFAGRGVMALRVHGHEIPDAAIAVDPTAHTDRGPASASPGGGGGP
jgi:hypothetical protein